jgi:hypothetical protein
MSILDRLFGKKKNLGSTNRQQDMNVATSTSDHNRCTTCGFLLINCSCQSSLKTEDNSLSLFVSNACKSKCSIAVNWKLAPKIIDMITDNLIIKHPEIKLTLDDIRRGVKIKCNKCNYSGNEILDILYYISNVGGYITNSRNIGSLDKGLCPSCGDNKAYITVSPTNIIRTNV